MTRSNSTVLVTRFWLDSTKSWLDPALTRKNFRWLWLDSDSKALWLWLDGNDSGTLLQSSSRPRLQQTSARHCHFLKASTMAHASCSTLTCWRSFVFSILKKNATGRSCWFNVAKIAFSDASVSKTNESFSSITPSAAEDKSSLKTLIAPTALSSNGMLLQWLEPNFVRIAKDPLHTVGYANNATNLSNSLEFLSTGMLDIVVKRNFWLPKFLTSRQVRRHRVTRHISNTLRKLMIRAQGLVFR